MSKPTSNVARAFLPAKTSTRLQEAQKLRLFLVPCSCGTTFAVPENFDQQGTQWSRFLICPNCGKRHDPRNRLLHLGYHREGYWKVDDC